MEIPNQLQRSINSPKPFELTKYVGDAFRITHRNFGLFIGATFLFFLLLVVAYLAIAFLVALVGGLLGAAGTLVISIIVGFALWAIIVPMAAGYANAAQITDRDEPLQLGDFFTGYSDTSRWGGLLQTSALTTLIVVLVSVLLVGNAIREGLPLLDEESLLNPLLLNEQLQASGIMASLRLNTIFTTVLSAVYIWSLLVTWFYGVRGWNALESSRKLMGWNFLWVILYNFLFFIAAFVAFFVIAIVAGIFFSFFMNGSLGGAFLGGILIFFVCMLFLSYLVPLYFNFAYASFADRVALNEDTGDNDDAEDKIIDHFMPDIN